MLSRVLTKTICTIALSGLCINLFSRDIQTGTEEVAGTASFSMQLFDNGHNSQISIDPSFYYYPSNNFFVGPLLRFSGNFGSGVDVYSIGIGGTAGALLSSSQSIIPYLGIGAAYLSSSVKLSANGFTYSYSGVDIPVFLGFKIRLSESFFMNIQPTYDFVREDDINHSTLLIGLGFSGIF